MYIRNKPLKCFFFKDVDECEFNNGNCSHICLNRPGYFECACPPTYQLSKDGVNCFKQCYSTNSIIQSGTIWKEDCKICECNVGEIICEPEICNSSGCPQVNLKLYSLTIMIMIYFLNFKSKRVHVLNRCCPDCLHPDFLSSCTLFIRKIYQLNSTVAVPIPKNSSSSYLLMENCDSLFSFSIRADQSIKNLQKTNLIIYMSPSINPSLNETDITIVNITYAGSVQISLLGYSEIFVEEYYKHQFFEIMMSQNKHNFIGKIHITVILINVSFFFIYSRAHLLERRIKKQTAL